MMSSLRSAGRLLVAVLVPLLSLVAFAGPAGATSVVIAGATMEGSLQLPPGSAVGGGYAVEAPPGVTVFVRGATVWLSYACTPAGPSVGELGLHLPDARLSGNGWQPAGDEAAWQSMARSVSPATSACGGRPVWVTERTGGATFTGKITSLPAGAEVSVRFHYRQVQPRSTAARWSPAEAITASAPAAASGPLTSPGGPVASPASGAVPTGAASDLGRFAPPAGGGGPAPIALLLLSFGGLALLGGAAVLLTGPRPAVHRRRRRPVRDGPAGPPSSARTRPR